MPVRKRSSTEADRESSFEHPHIFNDKENEHRLGDDISHKTTSRQEKRRSTGFIRSPAPVSPKKRTEAPTFSPADFGSPSKRRSLHGPIMDFSIFESDLGDDADIGAGRRSQDDIDWQQKFGSPLPSSRFSTIPKRSSSLRKSTLQQRQSERAPLVKEPSDPNDAGFSMAATPAFENVKKAPLRLSLDNHLPPMQRDSPFSSQGTLLSASVHPVIGQQASQTSQPPQGRHPLSRTMTQSSSTSSMMDDSPTHEPVQREDRPSNTHDFSKSLPLGALRPTAAFMSDDHSTESSQGSFATPGNYKSAKPLPAAFMSTGLISKKNRNVDDANAGLPKANMPDTPCKRPMSMFPPVPAFKASKAPAAPRPSRHSFGTPSTPLDSHHSVVKPAPFPLNKSVGTFGNSGKKGGLTRKTSFANIHVDDAAQSLSPTLPGDSQSTDSEYPPTPTKRVLEEQGNQQVSPSARSQSSRPGSSFGPKSVRGLRFTSSKLSPVGASPESIEEDSDGMVPESPSANLRLRSSLNALPASSSSFTRSRLLKQLSSPSPISRTALAVPLFHSPRSARAKLASLSPVSPHQTREHTSPHTPQEDCFPPDASRLSISGHNERVRFHSSSASQFPATPTGPREYFGNFSNRPSLNLNAPDAHEVDQSLSSRFERVELAGTGEFSQVYRVSQKPETSPFHGMYTISSTRSSSRSSLPEKVWAVKKSRHAYTGPKDRQRKIQEVNVLKTLGRQDHILTFLDSWEEKGHLYIQTEFCEEGTLDVFLAQVGLKARLDDFRIWKILLELSLGVRHIHDAGFIHLDLKPANVLISFEGVLKIGDFGMATRWPARAGIEGEGDREYIGPEILMGRYDKPADIFALGLIMLETAANVELPDNGTSWQKLRNGDMSDVPSLTWSSEASNIFRDASGNPLPENATADRFDVVDHFDDDERMGAAHVGHHYNASTTKKPSTDAHLARSGELLHPPQFMVDAGDNEALDHVVRWMISPDPDDRPVASQVLQTVGVQWAESRRRAGATVFEGNWGPADEILAEDAEMIDV